jgi:hypothetical protein
MLPDQNLYLNLFPRDERGKVKLTVEADRLWVMNEWVARRIIQATDRGTHGRSLANPKEKIFVQFTLSLARP